jgi:uncharacterized Zn-binding protein involved in type VI secretion
LPWAATVGDNTSHGTPLYPGPGSPNVLISGKPVWRVIVDSHTCPISEGPKPHTGGVVLKGSRTVLINGYFVARRGDSIVEAGVTNRIITGSPTVLIE